MLLSPGCIGEQQQQQEKHIRKRRRVVRSGITDMSMSDNEYIQVHQSSHTPIRETGTTTTTACTRIANRLKCIEPSNISGVCSTVSGALNSHLVVLGDSLYNCSTKSYDNYNNNNINKTAVGIRRTRSTTDEFHRRRTALLNNNTNQTNLSNLDVSTGSLLQPYYYEERIIEEDSDFDSDDDYDYDDDDDDDVEPILNWFYYDEPEIPAHPELEYETGHLVVVSPSPKVRPRTFINSVTHSGLDDDDVLLLNDDTTTMLIDNKDSLIGSNLQHHDKSNDDISNSSYYHYIQIRLALVVLILAGAMNVVTAKAQSISMYNYPIFLTLLHSVLAIPVTFFVTCWFNPKSRKETTVTCLDASQLTTNNNNTATIPSSDQNINPPGTTCIQFQSNTGLLLPQTEPNLNINRTHSTITNTSLTTEGGVRKKKKKKQVQISLSRLVLIGSLDAVATTLQIIATTYVPGSLVVLLPPAASTVLLYILTVLKQRKRRNNNNTNNILVQNRKSIFQRILSSNDSYTTTRRRNNRDNIQSRKKFCTKPRIAFVLGLLLVIFGTAAFVVLPIITSRHSPTHYCDITTPTRKKKNQQQQQKNEHHPANTCLLCRRADTEELCLQNNKNYTTKMFLVGRHSNDQSNSTSNDDDADVEVVDDGFRKSDDKTSIPNDTDDGNDVVCQWIPFEESLQEQEFIMTVWWSIVLTISTVPMVLSALLKQKLTRVTPVEDDDDDEVNAFVKQKSFIFNNNNNTINNAEPVRIEYTRSLDTDVETVNPAQSQQQRLHPTLQSILDHPTFWNAWITVIQFLVTILLIVPSYYLIRLGTVDTYSDFNVFPTIVINNASIDDDSNFSLSNDKNDEIVGTGHGTLIMSNLWNGLQCYGKGLDSIDSGCHPDTEMCSSGLAFWTVNLHFICSCLYKISFLVLLQLMVGVNNRLHRTQNQEHIFNITDLESCSETQDTSTVDENPIINSRISGSIDTRPLLTSTTTHRSATSRPKPKVENYHRYLFFALVATIPIADLIFWTLPFASWHHKFLDRIYSISLQNYNTLNWEENIIGLCAIVIGSILMHMSRIRKRRSKCKARTQEQVQPDSTNQNGTSQVNATVPIQQLDHYQSNLYLFDDTAWENRRPLLSTLMDFNTTKQEDSNTKDVSTANEQEGNLLLVRPMMVRRRHSDCDTIRIIGTGTTSSNIACCNSSVTTSSSSVAPIARQHRRSQTEQFHRNVDDLCLAKNGFSVLTSDV